jgi:Chaperone for flagella basal body P-ring formation
LDRQQIRGLMAPLASPHDSSSPVDISWEVPDRIVVKRAGATKSCAELTRFLAAAALQEKIAGTTPDWEREVDCAAAPAIPENAELAVVKTSWNGSLRRWEFRLHCLRTEDCVPFLLWIRKTKTAITGFSGLQPGGSGAEAKPGAISRPIVRPGQTATLVWDEAGIRVVLPVTCLDAGGLGQLVRVRFKSAPRVLRAEVLNDGTLRAIL